MITLYDKPEFKLKPDRVFRTYANVENSLELPNGKAVTIQIPARIFTITRFLGIRYGEQAKVYLDLIDGKYVFGISLQEDEDTCWDLWTYTEKSLPPFIRSAIYGRAT